MPLAPCPDCGREVSTSAPVCIHCGRPLAHPGASARPMAGIVTAVVLGVMGMALALMSPTDSLNEEIREMQWLWRRVQMVGNAALLIGALPALAGDRRGHSIVRGTSWAMIAAVVGMLMMGWRILAGQPPEDAIPGGVLALILVLSALLGTAPWWLYLYLFRKSRYP